MAGDYAYTPYIWPSFFTTILLVALSVVAWRRRSVPGAVPLAIGSLFAALWAAGALMETTALDVPTKVSWIRFQAAWQVPAVSAIACFVLEYTWPKRWLSRRNVALLSVPPLLFLALILGDDLHHAVWRGFLVAEKVIPQRAMVNWVFVSYGYTLGLLELVVFAYLFARSPQHRWPVAVMVSGVVGAHSLYLLDLTGAIRTQAPLDVLALAQMFLAYAIALFGFHILDPIPLARQMVFEQMQGGVFVLDSQGLVASVNPAAEGMLGAPARHLLGRAFQELLPASAAAPVDPLTRRPGSTEVKQGVGSEACYYSLESSPLKDWRGLEIGRLWLMYDITTHKQAQAELVEQQQALAMLHERERVARELHDSIGQILAFVNAQGQTIRRLLSRGDLATADVLTGRLVDIVREADVDIRESILGLRVVLSEQGIMPALAGYLASYENNYGIHVELEAPALPAVVVFEPLVEVQLLRILQEALTNVRKHAGARCVRITFALEDGHATITIRDDGQGFDPATRGAGASAHVGLQVMRERAEAVGGSLSLSSAPGKGTEVVVQVPVNERARDSNRQNVLYG